LPKTSFVVHPVSFITAGSHEQGSVEAGELHSGK
jgi:hypothetical protein